MLGQLVADRGQGFHLGLQGLLVALVQNAAQVGHGALHLAPGGRAHLFAQVGQALFRAVDELVGVVADLHQFLAGLVLGGVDFGVFDEPLDLLLAEAAGGGDLDGLLLARAQVLGRDVHDAVGVDVEGHLDLGHAARGRRNAHQFKAAQGLVAADHFPLALQDVDGHRRLVVGGRGENLAAAGGDGGIFIDELGEDPAQGLNAQGEGGDVQEEHVFHVAFQHSALDGRAHGHHLVGVDPLVGFLAENPFDDFLNLGHTGHAADQNDLVDVPGREAGVFQGGLAGAGHLFHQVVHQGFQLRAGQLDVQVLGPRGVGGDEGQIDVAFHGRGKLHLGPFRRLLEALQGHLVAAQVQARLFLELVGQPVDDPQVEVFAPQKGVAVGALHLKDAVAYFQNGNVEGAAAEIEDRDLLVRLFVQAVGQGRGRGLVDDAQDVQPGDAAGVFGGLALRVVEIGRHGDDRVGDRLAQVAFGGLLHLGQHHGRYFGRAVDLAPRLHGRVSVVGLGDLVGHDAEIPPHLGRVELAADEPFDRKDGGFGVGDGLALGHLAHQPFPRLGEGHDGRGGAVALGIGEHFGVAAFHEGHAGVGGAQVNADDF